MAAWICALFIGLSNNQEGELGLLKGGTGWDSITKISAFEIKVIYIIRRYKK